MELYPSNELLSEVKDHVSAKLNGTPPWALFLSWQRDGSLIYVESSSHSILATVDLRSRTLTMSSRISGEARGEVSEIPAHWSFNRDESRAS